MNGGRGGGGGHNADLELRREGRGEKGWKGVLLK